MADDSQLTVAELLARAQKENPGDEQPRRRRRRSLDEGGVSVAELTGSLRKVDARPVESKHSSVPIDPVDRTPKPQSAQETAPETVVLQKVDAPAPEQKAPAAAETTTWSKFERPAPAPVPAAVPLDATGEIPVVETETAVEQPVQDRTGEFDLFGADEPGQVAEPVEEDAAVNPISLVLFVFLGLVAGVLGFLAFRWVWASLPVAAAVILALVVTALVVVGVRALRTGKDGLSMTLAGIAGLVMTLGPGLINGL
ncbi:hypothetical protein [Corynebacterium qintianiae]|uniref:hypothetical protein n=1 Tax=Corynebacterium qintianiae TaxID=2709392 RepID=UPI0013EB5318|nr:hypothetical protein [Corynebacterium qintianiae]